MVYIYDIGASIFTLFFILLFLVAGGNGYVIFLYSLNLILVFIPRAIIAGIAIKK